MAALVVVAVGMVGQPVAHAQPAPYESTTPEGWLPHPLPTPAVPTVAFVGDSIGRDAQYYVRNQVGRTHAVAYYHAVAAGYIGYHLPRLLPVVRAGNGPDILLVELGTGDAFWDHSAHRFEGDVRRFLDAVLNLAPDGTPRGNPYVTCVRWFDQKPTANVAYPEVNEHRLEFNRVLGRVLAERRYRSRNVAMISYGAWYYLSGERGYFLADRLHHTQAGRRELGLLAGQAAEGCDPADTSGRFWDVPDRSGAATAINWMADAGIAEPYRNGTYRARLGSFAVGVDRGQIAEFLWRMAGSPTAPTTTWRDVPATLRPAVGWVQHTQLMRGYEDGTFHPSGAVSRVALATYLWRLSGQPTAGVARHTWSDVPPELLPAVEWAVTAGVMGADSGAVFGADRPATRAETARALYALDQLADAEAPTASTTTVAPPTTVLPDTTVPQVTAPSVSTVPATTVPVPTTGAATTVAPPSTDGPGATG